MHAQDHIRNAAELYKSGLSARQIGDELGMSRNAVLGLAFRNREMFPKRGGSPVDHADKPKKEKKARAHIPARTVSSLALDANPWVKLPRQPVGHVDPDPVRVIPPAPSLEYAVRLVYRQSDQCAWILGEPADMRQCGAPCDPLLSYCPHHSAIAYRVKPEVVRKARRV